MNGKLSILAAIGAVLAVMAAPVCAGIAGSDHDFSGEGWAGGQICIVCHTPHNSDVSVADAPLWNHEVSTALYTLYSSPTLDATVNQPSGASKLCLSCHDGSLECASCHDVHDRNSNDALLRISNAGSALCQTCHDI